MRASCHYDANNGAVFRTILNHREISQERVWESTLSPDLLSDSQQLSRWRGGGGGAGGLKSLSGSVFRSQ